MKFLFIVTILGSLGFGETQRYRALQEVFVAPPPSNESPTVQSCSKEVTITDNVVNYVDRLKFAFIYDSPVEILKANGAEVVFSFSQTLTANTSLATVAVDYSDANQGGTMVCDVRRNVLPAEVGVYNAKCLSGTARVIVYAQDPMFAPQGYAAGAPQRCSSILPYSDNTVMYAIYIPCRPQQNCYPAIPVCKDTSKSMLLVNQTFSVGIEVNKWSFTSYRAILVPAKSGNGYFLPGTYSAQTIAIPATAKSATVSFKVIERVALSDLRIQVNDTLVLDATYDCEALDPIDDLFDDISIKSVAIYKTKLDRVKLVIPLKWFAPNYRLKIALSGSVGIDDFIVTADCSGTPPVAGP